MTATVEVGTTTVLLVDDGPANLETYQKILRHVPDVVCTAFVSSKEALR